MPEPPALARPRRRSPSPQPRSEGARSLGRRILLQAAGRPSKQRDVLPREEVLQRAPRLQSTSKEPALKCRGNKGSSNAGDALGPGRTRSGAPGRPLPKEPTSAATPTPAARAQGLRGDMGVPVGPQDSRRAGSGNKAHREHLGSAGRTRSRRNSRPCHARDLHPGSEPALNITAEQRPQNATKPQDFPRAGTDTPGVRTTAAGGRTSPRRRKRSPLQPTSPADAVPVLLRGSPQGSQDQFGLRDRMGAGTSPLPPAPGAAG